MRVKTSFIRKVDENHLEVVFEFEKGEPIVVNYYHTDKVSAINAVYERGEIFSRQSLNVEIIEQNKNMEHG